MARLSLAIVAIILAIFAVLKSTEISIETDLLALAPNDDSPHLRQSAHRDLGDNFQSRALFLLTGSDAEQLAAASTALVEKLSVVSGVRVLEHELLRETVFQLFKEYRFQLISDGQRVLLQSGDAQAVLNERLIDRFGFGGTPQLIPLKDDPMAWHSRTLVEALSQLTLAETDPNAVTVPIFLSSTAFAVEDQARLLSAFEDITEEIEKRFGGVEVLEGGLFFHAAAAASNAKLDLLIISIVAGAGVALLLITLFRSPLALLIPILSVVSGIAAGFVATHILFSGVHIMALVFGASLIGVVVDYALHFFIHEQLASEEGSRRRLYRALGLSLMTSVLAYSVLATSGLVVLAQVATFSGVGFAVALIAVIALCPLVADRLALNDRFIVKALVPVIGALQGIRITIPICLAVLSVGISLGHQDAVIDSGNDPSNFITLDQSRLEKEQEINRLVARHEPGSFVFVSGESADMVHARARDFFMLLERDFQIDTQEFLSLTQFVPDAGRQRDNYDLHNLIYGSNGVTERFISATSLDIDAHALDLAYANARDQNLTPSIFAGVMGDLIPPLWFSNSELKMAVILIPRGADQESIRLAAAQVDGVVLDNLRERAKEGLRQKKKKAFLLLTPLFFLVALFLLLVYRDHKAILIALIPAASISCVAALLSSQSIPITLFHVMAMYLAIGLGLDYGIFVFEIRTRQLLAERAVLVSAATSLLSFGLLSVSSVPVIQGFGVTLLLANALNLLGSLWLAAWLEKDEEMLRPSHSA